MNEQQRAVVQQALDALEVVWREHKAIDGLRQLLEQPEPVQEPKFAPYWAVTDMEGKHIKVNIDTQRLEIYEEQRWAQTNVRSNTKAMLVYITKTPPAQPADYDRSIHGNPDAQAWAKFFVATAKEQKWCIDDIDEGLMIAWFANAMMAMHDHVKREEKGGA